MTNLNFTNALLKSGLILALFTITPFFVNECQGQIKCKFKLNDKDSFSGDRRIFTDDYNIGKFENMNKNLFATVRMINGYYFLAVYTTVDMGCAASRSKIALKTVNGDVYEQAHMGDIDCGKVTGAYSSIPAQVNIHLPDTLQDKEYAMIRVQFEKYANIIPIRSTIIKELCDCVKSQLK